MRQGLSLELDNDYSDGHPDVAFQIQENFNSFAIRHVEDGSRAFLTWQVGVLEHEHRRHPPRNNMPDGFRGTVTLFRLLGYGKSREEALVMAEGRLRASRK